MSEAARRNAIAAPTAVKTRASTSLGSRAEKTRPSCSSGATGLGARIADQGRKLWKRRRGDFDIKQTFY